MCKFDAPGAVLAAPYAIPVCISETRQARRRWCVRVAGMFGRGALCVPACRCGNVGCAFVCTGGVLACAMGFVPCALAPWRLRGCEDNSGAGGGSSGCCTCVAVAGRSRALMIVRCAVRWRWWWWWWRRRRRPQRYPRATGVGRRRRAPREPRCLRRAAERRVRDPSHGALQERRHF